MLDAVQEVGVMMCVIAINHDKNILLNGLPNCPAAYLGEQRKDEEPCVKMCTRLSERMLH